MLGVLGTPVASIKRNEADDLDESHARTGITQRPAKRSLTPHNGCLNGIRPHPSSRVAVELALHLTVPEEGRSSFPSNETTAMCICVSARSARSFRKQGDHQCPKRGLRWIRIGIRATADINTDVLRSQVTQSFVFLSTMRNYSGPRE